MKKNLNQNLINLIEYYSLINANLLLSNTPIKRNFSNSDMLFSRYNSANICGKRNICR